ncbi:hypothetical protein DWW36_12300 [Erysipelotrichaceae bacterium AF15-26LB]|nr:hypothetical protein [[Clostridium] innocuum]RJV87112.1 hypothetical protein DWW36_12300 [Erysipelotrichaceae bacterium AF15-26LB]
MQYGNLNVDEKYSSLVEPNLYSDNILEPGVTYNEDFQGDADSGLVKVYKQKSDGATDATTPAGDFEDTKAENELIDIRLNNSFRKSKKIYKVQAGAVSYPLADTTFSTALSDVKEGYQAAGVACLTTEGVQLTDTTAITSKNVKSAVLNARKAIRKKKAKADVVFASVDVFTAMLEAAGDQFTPAKNDEMIATGQVGYWLGMKWYEANAMENTAAVYYDHAGTKHTVDLTGVDFVMYDHRFFSIVDNLEEMRIIDSEKFVGSLAQIEINAGYRVTTADGVIVKANKALETDTPTE